METTFEATLHKITIDRDGEAKIILVIPLVEVKKVIPLHECYEKTLRVTIKENELGTEFSNRT